LRVRGLRANLEIGVSETLADGVNADVVTSLEKIDVGELTLTGRV
jgi:hypothetical protein